MPKDRRLYMTFPIDIHRHPKLQRLSPDVKWAFVEMNGEARIAGNDGRFTAEDAEYLWPTEVIDALINSHPTRPLIVRDGTDIVIRDYSEHQQTAADIEDLTSKRSAAGRQGAAVTNSKRAANAAAKVGTSSASAAASAEDSAALAEQVVGKPRQASAESESESEIELPDVTNLPASGPVSNAGAKETDQGILNRLRTQALTDAQQLGIGDLTEVRDWLEKAAGTALNLGQAVELSGVILGKARGDVREPDRYVIGVCRKSPGRVAQYADGLDLGAVA